MFIKLIRSLAQEVVSEGAAEVTAQHVEAALDERRRLLGWASPAVISRCSSR